MTDQRLANGSRNTDPMARQETDEHRAKLPSSSAKLEVPKSRPRNVRANRKANNEYRRICAMPRSADVKCERSVAVVIASMLLCLSRCTCADQPMVETFVMTMGNLLSVAMVIITFVDVAVNNTVTWTLAASSVCVHKQCNRMDSERIVSLRS